MSTPIGTDSARAAALGVDTARRPRPEKPLIETTGGRGGLSVEAIRDLWLFRETLWAFTVRSVAVRYKQASIGIAWAVVQPVVAALLFAVFLGRLSHLGSEGVAYLPFALAGMVCWTFFSATTTTASESLVRDSALLRKVYFPREILPLSTLLAGVVDYLPGLATLIVVACLYGYYPALPWILLPVPLLILLLAATALGLAASAANVYYRDVRYALPFIISIGLFASPIAYSLSVVPERWRTLYAIGNPVAAAIDAQRRIVLHGTWPDLWITVGAIAWSAALTVAAYAVFKRVERGFADRI